MASSFPLAPWRQVNRSEEEELRFALLDGYVRVSPDTDFGGLDVCVAARAEGRGYVSEKASFDSTHFQSGTDLVGRRYNGSYFFDA